ncbi:MAG TPA: ankyrin repeat domain-containing protein [Thiobacillus sp.]
MPYRDDWYQAEQLHRAAQDGNLDDVIRLVSEGFKVNQFDDLSRTPLHYAVEGEHYLVAKWLLENGADVNANEEEKIGETALSLAAEGGYPEIVELLLMHGANPDIPGWMSITARHRAQKRNDEDGVKINALLNRYCPAV